MLGFYKFKSILYPRLYPRFASDTSFLATCKFELAAAAIIQKKLIPHVRVTRLPQRAQLQIEKELEVYFCHPRSQAGM